MNLKHPVLQVEHISKSYGSFLALKDVSLTLLPGEVHALLGGNGAGKSTLINIISGARQFDSGLLKVNGAPVNFASPRDSLESGIAVVYQELSVLPHLTVMENISLINRDQKTKGLYNWRKAFNDAIRVLNMLGGPAKNISPDMVVYNLRSDQRQLIEIARAVNFGAKVILLDEPTSSLNFEETKNLFHVVKTLCSQGIGFIFVSHRLAEIREISDRVTVIRDGETVLDGMYLKEITDSQLITAMLGREFSIAQSQELVKVSHTNESYEILKVNFNKILNSSISVNRGEVVGLAGLSGSGRSSLLRTIWGAQRRSDVDLFLLNKEFLPHGPRESMAKGIAYIGEDRRENGLYLNLPLSETLMSPKRVVGRRLFVSKSESDLIKKIINILKVKIPSLDASPSALSGGNQQKLLFGRWLTTRPQLFLLDEPTRGVDVATKFEIYNLIRQFTNYGAGVIVVSSEISELVTLSNKVVVLGKGLPIKILSEEQITEEKILEFMTVQGTV
ncbi:sugar ABC transporter ATP-binding protein [Alicyclobacillus tolerans]|uniref:sugar ABC transporter ATP-binding protein n=1 Tax=Alicyclobacillus tolerans TaxID=90970 RepID=UPI001F484C44|nr:sugar ABC transporter ATP-binding protein [Alicyclobacillus tolerans]MCF8568114.1 sugar ABC transporter ATP-binding protein [Alicyclobacillus tolerans]